MLPLKGIVKVALNRCGLEIRRLTENPQYNTLGLRSLGIQTVLDVGANEGQFARYVTRVLPSVRIYSFEPLTGPFAKLKQWTEEVNPPRANIFNLALGQEEGWIEMFEHVNITGHSSVLNTTDLSHSLYPQTRQQRTTRVAMTKLDTLLDKGDIELVPEILLKLDVQGYEDRVLRGAPTVLAHARACLLEVNFDPLYKSQATFQELFEILSKSGYRYAGCFGQGFGVDGHVIGADELFVR